ncbi:MAG: hypothetical protein COC06_07630 [Bacteroidales bacterium]|nr:MAG: hypothetical protein COC06_07630 [Bacteroidales bacterium]
MENLYLKICQRIKERADLFITNNLPPVNYIDLYRGQPLAPERFELYDLPALFLEYNINWESNLLTLNVHVVTDQTHSTASISPNKLTGLQIFTLYKVVKQLLNDLSSETTGKLKLTGERPAEADVVNYQILDFTCSIEESELEEKFAHGTIESLNVEKKLTYNID